MKLLAWDWSVTHTEVCDNKDWGRFNEYRTGLTEFILCSAILPVWKDKTSLNEVNKFRVYSFLCPLEPHMYEAFPVSTSFLSKWKLYKFLIRKKISLNGIFF